LLNAVESSPRTGESGRSLDAIDSRRGLTRSQQPILRLLEILKEAGRRALDVGQLGLDGRDPFAVLDENLLVLLAIGLLANRALRIPATFLDSADMQPIFVKL
jgi:hypothetical protein